MKTTIEALTLIRDHIRSKCLPTTQGKTKGKWVWYNDGYDNYWYLVDSSISSVIPGIQSIDPLSKERNASFLAMTSDTAEPAWLCVAEEIDKLLPMFEDDIGWRLYAKRRASSIINNWKGVIQ